MTATWQLKSLKFDGQTVYSYPVLLTQDETPLLHFRAVERGLMQHFVQGWEKPNPFRCDLYFWRDRWFNVFVNYTDDLILHNFYCNITLPPEISYQFHIVSFVDLDLDVRVRPDGTYKILDEDEFEANSAKYSYPAHVRNGALRAVKEAIAMVEARSGPFRLINDRGANTSG